MTVFDDFSKRADDIRFEVKIHCQVRIVPIADNPHALKVLALVVHLFSRVLATLLTKLCRSHFVARLANFLLNVELNG